MPNHRKPTAQKKAQGTYRKDRAVNEAQPEPADLKPPASLEGKKARDLYVEIARTLKPHGLFTVADREQLAQLVRVQLRLADLEKSISTTLMEGATGSPIADPRFPAYRDLLKHLSDLRRGFGMDPASRSRIDVPESEPDEGDGMENIINGSFG
jgi:P27 family predicted phage terminase small subunit